MKFFNWSANRVQVPSTEDTTPPFDSSTGAQRKLDEGIALEQQGQLDGALQCYDEAILLQPSLARAHFNRGNILLDKGDSTSALLAYSKAIELKPDSATAYYNMGNAHLSLGNVQQSVTSCRQAIALKPDFAPAHMTMGVALSRLQRYADAVECFTRVVKLTPKSVDAHFQRGIALHDLGKFSEAIASYQSALSIESSNAVIHTNLGSAFKEQGNFAAAIASFQTAISIDPDLAEAHYNLAVSLQSLGLQELAIASYLKTLAFSNDKYDAHVNLGVAYRELRQYEKSVRSLSNAIELDPKNAAGHLSLGMTLAAMGQHTAALESYGHALEIDQKSAPVHVSQANVHKDLGRFDAAFSSIQRALQLDPDYILAHNNLLFIQNYVGHQTAERLLADAKRFGAVVTRQARPFKDHTNSPNPHKVLKIGFVSGDLGEHPVGYFLESVLSALQSQSSGQLEIFAYPTFPSDDETSKRLKTCCQGWHSAVGLSDEALAKRIRQDGIDILVDLAGHTAHNRLPVFAWKPAPIQVSWLGYCATTGVAEMDYYIADAIALPSSLEGQFVESIWRLPESYLCLSRPNANVPVVAAPALTSERVTFGSFNNLTKMTDETVHLWARILHAVPQSRLFLKSRQLGNESVLQATLARYANHGIGADRLILEGHVNERGSHLAAYNRVDIALDPFPYNGVTTTAEALWMGVPVLTLAGDRFLARQGVSLLTNAGLPDWIASDLDDYVDRAMRHASDLKSLATLRSGLRQQVLASPIFDAARFATHFEAALRGMWEKWTSDHEARCPREPNITSSVIDQSQYTSEHRMWLHIGGKEVKSGWKILNAINSEGVDFVGDVRDLNAFSDSCCEKIYASHVMEHIGQKDFSKTLKGIHRLLVTGGEFYFSVPDLDALCRLFVNPRLTGSERFHVMRMMFGGQTDDFDFHYIGLTYEFMLEYFNITGFSSIRRVENFGLFDDTSSYKPYGVPISLNLIATK